MVAAIKDVRFDYVSARIADIRVKAEPDKQGRQIVKSVIVADEEIQPSSRFFTSISSRYNFSPSIFSYFSHKELFDRISAKRADDRVRVCIERREGREPIVLAAANPTKPVVPYEQLMELVGQYGNEGVSYQDGVVNSTHIPRVAADSFKIGPDLFQNRFTLSTPIDGYGAPSVYLSMLRLICANGLIGFAPAFKTTLSLGKGADDVRFAIGRALDSFNHDEGYSALRTRIEASQKSWASVREVTDLYELLLRLQGEGRLFWSDKEGQRGHPHQGSDVANLVRRAEALHQSRLNLPGDTDVVEEKAGKNPILAGFHRLTHDLSRVYGIANLKALSTKRQALLPAELTLFDAFNFATEVATRHTDQSGANRLHALVSQKLVGEYDLENSCEKHKDFASFWVQSEAKVDGKQPVAMAPGALSSN